MFFSLSFFNENGNSCTVNTFSKQPIALPEATCHYCLLTTQVIQIKRWTDKITIKHKHPAVCSAIFHCPDLASFSFCSCHHRYSVTGTGQVLFSPAYSSRAWGCLARPCPSRSPAAARPFPPGSPQGLWEAAAGWAKDA